MQTPILDSSYKKSNVIAWIYADLDNSYIYLYNYFIKGWFLMINFALEI